MTERLVMAAAITFLLNIILNLNTRTVYSAQQPHLSTQETLTIAQSHPLPALKSILKLGNY